MTGQGKQLPHKQTYQFSWFSPTKKKCQLKNNVEVTHMHRIFVILTRQFLSHSVNGDSRSRRLKVYVDSLHCLSFLLQFCSVVPSHNFELLNAPQKKVRILAIAFWHTSICSILAAKFIKLVFLFQKTTGSRKSYLDILVTHLNTWMLNKSNLNILLVPLMFHINITL